MAKSTQIGVELQLVIVARSNCGFVYCAILALSSSKQQARRVYLRRIAEMLDRSKFQGESMSWETSLAAAANVAINPKQWSAENDLGDNS